MRRARVDLLKQVFVHGLHVDSAFAFRHGDLAESSGVPDLRVVCGALPARPLPDRAWSNPFPGQARCDLPFGRIQVDDGERITVDTDDWPTLRPWVVGTAFAIAAQQRGRLVLHASTVALDGLAFAFAAASGVGKSTLVAALVAEGARLVAEDVTAIDAVAWPGPQRLRLHPSAAATLHLDDLEAEPPSPGEPTRKLGWTPPGVDGPVPLGAVVVLEPAAPDAPPRLIARPPHLAWGALVTNSYTLRLLHEPERISHLQACADIGGKASVFDAHIPRSMLRLPEIAAWIRGALAAATSARVMVAPEDRG